MNTTAMAKACLATATALQQLAAALEAEPAAPCSDFLPPPGGGYVCARCGDEWQHHARRVVIPDPPASMAEPECGCSLYARCEQHEATRPKACKCNGPMFPSSACGLEQHRHVARTWPDRDPALVD